MVHPSHLLRLDSERGQRFAAPMGNYFNDVDCGISALPCFAKRLRLDKLAKLSVFLTVLSILGLLHGIISTYFKGTSQLWFSHYNFPSFIEDWFVFMNEIFVGILALCISYWGDRLHRATCMGALTMLIGVSGATLAIPEMYNPFTKVEITNAITGPALCKNEITDLYTKDILGTEGFNEVTFGYFFIFQIMFSMLTISFITHGLTYVDDHISAKHSPALIGLALAAHEAGKQFGIYFSWVPYILKIISIFSSPVWIIFVCLTFIVGAIMALFPKMLPNLVIKKSVTSLVNIASGGRPLDDEELDPSFCRTVWALLKNEVLLINIMSFVLIQSALMNFSLFEKFFNQSKYHVPIEEKDSTGYSDPDIIQFTTNLLRQPLVAISLITCGMIISKIRPKAKYLVTWNIIAFLIVVLIFSSTVFWKCASPIQNELKHAITIPYCSSKCSCPIGESFQPVCVDGKTYFSPCLAGCNNYSTSTMLYHNCSCGTVVTSGSCDEDNCKFILALAQVNNILTSGLLATTFLINIVITLRSVSTRQKATALGLELTFLGIVPFIPVKIIYHSIASSYCEIHSQKGCQYFSESFTLVISLITISLMLAAIVLSVILLYFTRDLDLYTSNYGSNNFELTHENGTNNLQLETPNTISGGSPSDENRQIEEDSPFIKQLGERIKNRFQRPLSREDRIQSYVSEGDLVPTLTPTNNPSQTTSKSDMSNIVVVHSESNGQPVKPESRPNSRNSNKRHSKVSGESDMSSLYRFADSIIDPVDDSESEPSIKVSQGKIVFQNIPHNVTLKRKKPNDPVVIIAPDRPQPNRPAPVPDFLIETNF